MGAVSTVFLRVAEWIAAMSLCVAMLIVTASALGRYLLSMPIPDAFDISRMLIGAGIAWGLAAVELRGTHIRLELFSAQPRSLIGKSVVVFGWAAGLAFAGAVAWTMWGKVAGAVQQLTVTSDLRLPLWPFYGLIWGGIAAVGIAALLSRFYTAERAVEDRTYE